AFARENGHEPLARQPLQRLADRRAADLQTGRQHLLGQDFAWTKPQRDDLLLDQPVGPFGERIGHAPPARPRAGAAASASNRRCCGGARHQICLLFATMDANFSYSASFTEYEWSSSGKTPSFTSRTYSLMPLTATSVSLAKRLVNFGLKSVNTPRRS